MKNKIIFSVIALMLLLIVGSCEREIDSSDPVRSVPDVGPIVTNLKAAMKDQSITLTWDVINGTNVSQYRVYQSTDEGDIKNFVILDSSDTRSIGITDLLINNRYYFKVAAVTTEGLEWDKSDEVSSQFTYLSISIAGGDEYSKTRSVIVSINAPVETSHLRLSEDNSFAGEVFVPFVGTGTQFELSNGDGTKTVYCELQFQDGSITGEILSDDIILDTKAEINSITYSDPVNSEYYQAGETIIFYLDADEAGGEASIRFGSGGNFVSFDVFDDGVNPDVNTNNGIYTGRWTVPSQYYAYEVQVEGFFSDAAKNAADILVADDLMYVFTPPPPVFVTATVKSSHSNQLTWDPSTSQDFSAYRIFRSTSPGVSDLSLQVNFLRTNVDNYDDEFLDDNTTYYYIIYTYTSAGLSSASNVVSARTLINTAPDAVELFAEQGTSATTTTLNWSKSNDLYFNSYRIYRSSSTYDITTSDDLVDFISTQNTLSSSVPLDTVGAPASNYFKIFVVDGHGLMTGSNSVQVDIP